MAFLALLWTGSAVAAPFSAETHDVYPGDFNADGKSDLLVIAKDPAALSGIYATAASGQPSTQLQSWHSGYLGISWHDSRYTAVIGNFDGVNGDDVLLQRNGSGRSFLLPTNAQGQLSGISQPIDGWGTDTYRIVAGRFNADGRADVFLQARTASANSSVILSDGAGHLTVTSQTLPNNHLGFKWSVANAIVHAGDFDGDGLDDLLVQAKAEIALIDYDIPIPVPVYKANAFGIIWATPAGQFVSIYDLFSRKDFGVDFAPTEVDLVVGKFNDDDGKADILLLARKAGQSSFVVLTDGNGQVGPNVVTIAPGTLGAELRTLAADFNGDGRSEVYRLASTAGGSSSIVSFTSSGSIAANVTHSSQPLSVMATTAVGRTAGQASVSASGAAQYSLELWSPPGTNGLQPRIGIEYDSSNANGILGMGFELTGFSSITRCAKTIAQDGISRPVTREVNDAYCLDGQRMRLDSNSGPYGSASARYRTEVESYNRIAISSTGTNGPATFVMHRRDGLIYEYGQTADSRVEFPGSSDVRVWALNAILDRSGNRISFSYLEDPAFGSYRPSAIAYTSNPNAGIATAPYSINFIYEGVDRPDPIVFNDAGSAIRETRRVARIEVRHQASVQRQYLLSYTSVVGASGRSRLGAIQECAGSTAECLAPSHLTWTNSVTSSRAVQDPGQPRPPGGDAHQIDINGDGIDDLVYESSATSGAGTVRIRLADGNGNLQPEINTGFLNTNFQHSMSLEWDGDGRMDLLVPYASNRWHVLRSNGGGFDAPLDTGVAAIDPSRYFRLLDINGDGRDDLVRISNSSTAATVWVRYRNQNGFDSTETQLWSTFNPGVSFDQSGFFTQPHEFKYRSRIRRADFDGDGREDFIALLSDYDFESNSTVRYYGIFLAGEFVGQLGSFDDLGGNHLWADINGDGLTDIVWLSVTQQIRSATNVGSGSPSISLGPMSSSFRSTFSVVSDYDGDGRDDLLMATGATTTTGTPLSYFRSLGQGFAAGVGIEVSWSGQTLQIGDLDGDEFGDVTLLGSSISYQRQVGTPGDLLDTVSDGYGVFAHFDYVRTTAGMATYTRGSGAVYPMMEMARPGLLVSQLSTSDGAGSSYQQTFSYQGGRENLLGRGFVGFARRTSIDSRTGIRTEQNFLQDANEYQSLGLPYLVQVKQADGTLIREVSTDWQKLSFGSGTTERRYPYVGTEVIKQYEVGGAQNGQLISTTTTTNLADTLSGLIYDSTVSVLEAASANGIQAGHTYSTRTQQGELINDLLQWCLGRPGSTQISNSHTLTSGASITRRQSTLWDSQLCRPTQTVIEPGNPQLQVATNIGYDSFGNPNSITVTPASGQGQAARTSLLNWGSSGQFPRTLTNPKGHVTTFDWNVATGWRTGLTDLNNLQTLWVYDSFGRMTRQQRSDGTATDLVRSGCTGANCSGSQMRSSVQIIERDSGNNIVRVEGQQLDDFDRVRSLTQQLLDGRFSTVTVTYDPLGRVAAESTPYEVGEGTPWYTNYSYDIVDRLKVIQRPTSQSDLALQSTQFNYSGLTTSLTDALNHTRQQRRNVVGSVVQAIDASGASTYYEYDAFGNLLKSRDPANNEIVLSYDVRGFKLTSNDPDLGAWSYSYYPLGELKSQTTANNQTVTFTYDALSRPLMRTEPEGVTTWTWDTASKGIGQLAAVSSPGGYSESYLYDTLGRPAQQTIVADTISYAINQTYNPQGLPDTLTYPTSTAGVRFKVRYGYAFGALQTVRDFTGDVSGTTFWRAQASDLRGQITEEEYGNGVRTRSAYDLIRGTLESRTAGSANAPTTLQNLAYRWDKVGNLTERRDLRQSLTEAFTYDSLDRLDFSTLNGTVNLDVAYDALGNITSRSNVGSYTYHPTKKHAVTSAGSNTYTYDANGNAITRNGSSISWTSYNLPSLINGSGGNSSQFSYDPQRQRWKQQANYAGTAEETIYVGGLVEKVTQGGVTSWRHHITAGSGEIAIYTRQSTGVNEIHYLSKDHLDSTDVISSSAGAAELRSSFGSFGQRRNAAGWSGTPAAADVTAISATTRHGFTGHEMLDNLNLTHMNGRVYDQITGRFLSADPFVQDPFDSQSLNRYSYVSNNPLSFTDPSGFLTQNPPSPDAAPMPTRSRLGGPLPFQGIDLLPVYEQRVRLTHPNQRTRAPATGTPLTQGTVGAGFGAGKVSAVSGDLESAIAAARLFDATFVRFFLAVQGVRGISAEILDPFTPIIDTVEDVSNGNFGGAIFSAATVAVKPLKAGKLARPVLEISRSKLPAIAANIENALRIGKPALLERVSEAQKAINRLKALSGAKRPPKGSGLSLDEFPFACSKQGGAGACIATVPKREQDIQGGLIKNFFDRFKIGAGDEFEVRVVD